MELIERKKVERKADNGVSRMKRCVFCAELIQAEAVKCRICGEFLNTDKARRLQQIAEQKANGEQIEEEVENGILFAGSPSLLGLAGKAAKAAVLAALGIFLYKYPVENLVVSFLYRFSDFQISDSQYFALVKWRQIAGVGIAIMAVLLLLLRALKLKMTYYEVTPERVEYSRGILDRQVDNLDMFRVVDLKLRRTILDCLLGIGEVTLITSDKSDPNFVFKKVHRSRKLYDTIKRASLEADQDQRVVHLE